MGRQFTARSARASTTVSAPAVAAAVFAIILLVAGFGWFVTIAPPLVSFAVAVGAAMAWCAWLEKHPDAAVDADREDVVTGPTPAKFSVHVLATTHDGTKCALTVAKRLTTAVDARIVLLVPRRQSSAVPFDSAGNERTTLIDEHRGLAASVGVHVIVLFCVCDTYDDVVHQMLGRSALVIVGGRARIWWPSPEQRLVSRLIAEGYPVVFAQTGAEQAPAHGHVMSS